MVNKLLIILFLFLVIFVGCENMKCRPDAKLENKKGDWFLGGSCKGEW